VTWENITSQGRLVYYRCKLGRDEWLAVSKAETGWRWRWYGPDRDGHAWVLNAEGVARTSRQAQKLAEQTVANARAAVKL
jgi:hypothetical protein